MNRFQRSIVLAGSLVFWLMISVAVAQDPIPGTTIYQSPIPNGATVKSSSFVILANGDYVASHFVRRFNKDVGDLNVKPNETLIHRSTDKGKSWKQISTIPQHVWANLFLVGDKLYSLGVSDSRFGRLAICRSDDGGVNWTPIRDGSGFLTAQSGYYTFQSVPVVHQQRVWAFVERDLKQRGFTTYGISAPLGADLLDPQVWERSSSLRLERNSLGGKDDKLTQGIALANGSDVMGLFRVTSPVRENVAIGKLMRQGSQTQFGITQLVEFPGGANSFGAVADNRQPGYWAVSLPQSKPFAQTNRLMLLHSDDLKRWERRYLIVGHRDGVWHGFQTVNARIDGDSLVVVATCAWGETPSAAKSNRLVCLVVPDFRTLQMSDSPPLVGKQHPKTIQHTDFEITGDGIGPGRLESGVDSVFFYGHAKWKTIPIRFAGWGHTKMAPARNCEVKVTAKRDTVIYVAVADEQHIVDMTGWEPVPEKLTFDNDRRTRTMTVFSTIHRAGADS